MIEFRKPRFVTVVWINCKSKDICYVSIERIACWYLVLCKCQVCGIKKGYPVSYMFIEPKAIAIFPGCLSYPIWQCRILMETTRCRESYDFVGIYKIFCYKAGTVFSKPD